MSKGNPFFPDDRLPDGFSYPDLYVAFSRDAEDDDLYPWMIEDADSESGELSMYLGERHERKLVPFAFLDLGDGDLACFDGLDTTGDPSVIMMITDGSGRSYGFDNFSDWLSQARYDAENYKLNLPMKSLKNRYR